MSADPNDQAAAYPSSRDEDRPGSGSHHSSGGASWYFDAEPEPTSDDEYDDDDDDDDDPTYHDAWDILDEGEEDEEDEEDEDEEGLGVDPEDEDEDDGMNFEEEEVTIELVVGEEVDEGNLPLLRLLRAARAGRLTNRQLVTLLHNPDVQNLLSGLEGQGNEEQNREWRAFHNRRHRRDKDPNRFPKVPSDEGSKLMAFGAFGSNNIGTERKRQWKKHLASCLLDRELALGSYSDVRQNNNLIDQSLIPITRTDQIIHHEDPVYSGQFSNDGNFFYSCCQDFKVRLYDTSNPYNWKYYKSFRYPWGQWTLTDASLSPDNKWLAYTSISSLVSIAPTDPLDTGDPYTLDLDVNGDGGSTYGFSSIWSVRFSGDGRELIAGTNRNSIVVYDIESRRTLHYIDGHENDVNAVCFADKLSPHIIYSGSDDATIKVWDRRSMASEKEVGAFVGHTEGLTYIDSKGDGRYILSNGKDQSMKLWDIRMAMSRAQFTQLNPRQHTRFSDFDYRSGYYDENEWDPHPNDNSVVTFRGHKVLSTLIRCHFSPPSSTDSRYVYSGSKDGKVYIWNMDATLAGTIDVKKGTAKSRRQEGRARWYRFENGGQWSTCVRDASWHPTAPMIAASSWNGYSLSHGTVSVHSFNEAPDDEGEPPMSRSVDEELREQDNLYSLYNEGW